MGVGVRARVRERERERGRERFRAINISKYLTSSRIREQRTFALSQIGFCPRLKSSVR